MSSLKLPVSAIDLVPHRNRMLLIDSLDEFDKNMGRAGLHIPGENLFIAKDGRLDSIAYVEFLAQLIAAHSGYESKLDKSDPKVGFLVGIKDFSIYESIAIGDIVDLQIKKEYEFDQINFVIGKILYKNHVIAEGTLTVWEHAGGNAELENPQEDNQPAVIQSQLSDNLFRAIVDHMILNVAILENIYDFKIAADKLSVNAQLYFSNNFIGFDGHFPGAPLLPGILMMKTGLLVSEIMVGKRLCVERVKHAKFAKSIFPKQKVDPIQINATLRHNEELCAKYSILTKIE